MVRDEVLQSPDWSTFRWWPSVDRVAIRPESIDAASVEGAFTRVGTIFWRHPTDSTIILEGYDAGVSFRSSHDPRTQTTASVLGNSSDGARPMIRALNDAQD